MGVDGDEDGFDAEGAGVGEELGGFGAVGVDVELQEEGLVGAAGMDDGGEGVGCVVGYLQFLSALFNLRLLESFLRRFAHHLDKAFACASSR